MKISVLIQLLRIINIQIDSITIVASMYWFLRPLSWDTCILYFSLSSFLRKKEIKICGYNPIHFYPGGNVGEVFKKWDDIKFKDKEIVWLPMDYQLSNDSITIMASVYWFLRPRSWDTWMVYFSLSSFLRKKEIKICGYNPIRFYSGGNVGFMVTLKK
ncbi:hypothetical protein H5410_062507 [Solanum commersonii]|uniref:Uncharacterized protein n=1 Tax=Solanum commersonii TaxID=4109 RepID=A0A9J5WB27_SOLCO|nr:hypothetical protein H5410_062507 [Solanum commersonii]